eukprot:2947469-Alexandrium_andersonii.AAC.1
MGACVQLAVRGVSQLEAGRFGWKTCGSAIPRCVRVLVVCRGLFPTHAQARARAWTGQGQRTIR